ncbi:hypothetical protein TNCV_4906921 [Trichonephila clavipes]|uniref:Uncharacterized protein n=1 Tax=Trichonephila clavipes TaxID=2585209 RepID=A0A8X6V7S0_TRICX|nr:hypothetical protein TNCV_4906921 [Trichonephila clavipes]
MAARKRLAIDSVYIPDDLSDSESDFSFDSDSDINFSDCSSSSDESDHDSILAKCEKRPTAVNKRHAQQLSTATRRQVSRFTVARRLHKGAYSSTVLNAASR